MKIENHYHPVFISRPDKYLRDTMAGILRMDNKNIDVTIRRCPVESGPVIAAFGKEYRNGRYIGKFVALDREREFQTMPLREALLYAVIENDMWFKNFTPTGWELEKHYNIPSASFMFMYRQKENGLITARDVYYTKKNGWMGRFTDSSPSNIKYYFERRHSHHAHMVVIRHPEHTIPHLEKVSSQLEKPLLKMDRTDKLLEALV